MRIKYLDVTKGIAISLMVLGHAFGMSETRGAIILIRYIYSFHIPLFFVIYGYLYNPQGKSFFPLLQKRAKSYLIPYFIWGGLYSGTSVFKKAVLLLYASHQTLELAETVTALWFLPVLFVATIVYSLICMISFNRGDLKCIVALIVAVVSAILPSFENGYPWGINIGFIGVFFMIVGATIRDFLQKTKEKFIILCAIITPFILLLGIVNGEVNTSVGIFGKSYILFLVLAIWGSYGCIVCGKYLSGFSSNVLEHFGKHSLGILCIHRPFLWLTRDILVKIGVDINLPIAFVLGIVALFAAYYGAILIKKIIPEIV